MKTKRMIPNQVLLDRLSDIALFAFVALRVNEKSRAILLEEIQYLIFLCIMDIRKRLQKTQGDPMECTPKYPMDFDELGDIPF